MDIKYLEYVENHIKQDFEILRYIGSGSYGKVWKAIDKQNQNICAIKRIFGAFRNCVDAQRTVREVCFLFQLSKNQNVVQLKKVIKSQNTQDLYLIFEYIEFDLHYVNQKTKLAPYNIQYIIYQILLVLQYIHSGGLIHRDLKPQNLLINTEWVVKLADFGLARCIYELDEINPIYTENVSTITYRAPEILFGSKRYSYPVDMWSVGCILFELLTGKPLFLGQNKVNQIQKIIEFLDKPNIQEIKSFQLENPEMVQSWIFLFQKGKTVNLDQILQDAQAQDFLINCIKYNPKERMTVEQALKHPYIQKVKNNHHLQEQLSYDQFISLENEVQLQTVEQFRQILDKFLDFKGNDIYKFICQISQEISKQKDQIKRNTIQIPPKLLSKNQQSYQMRQLTSPMSYQQKLKTLMKKVAQLNTVDQDLQNYNENNLNEKTELIQNLRNIQIKKISQQNNSSAFQEEFKVHRRLSLQTDCTQQSNNDQFVNFYHSAQINNYVQSKHKPK